ncbi:uncharacterized protein A1O5_07796 [Cladophialophora psammophila CBS 110553]|uniref:Non-structural maintenance of chromosomes element 1 homolog n=1 Tax=Cladophialophora psammophila CBS 110553 TaxID=1182543 RepID=W9XES0_9EURO|nr:uncharacterized protein A1O5_07796 [Cladophialophora psammophila CBS 110553]EXJ68864.1 hypothetical protein A1O5_07796 [Cladophialophora psammophila CBS 110553]
MDIFGDGPGYNDANRAFLQAFLARSVLTLETAKPIIAACSTFREQREVLPQDVTVEDLNDYIADANRRLSPLDFEIRSTLHQQTRERVYALVNTTSDPLMQLATSYTADEIVYVRKLLDAMFDGQNNQGKREAMCISGIDAIQVGRAALRRQANEENEAQVAAAGVLSAMDSENMLHKLLDEGWLEKSRAGFYNLSPRALMELKGWLVDTYNDEDEDGNKREKIKFCHACKEIITVGQRCPRRECPCRVHDICTQNFFRIQRSTRCPLCRTEWDGECFVGEKSITTSESYQTGKRRSGAYNRRRPSAHANNEEDDVE